MLDRTQFVAGGSAEVGVLSQYLDGELHFVDDTLAGRLISRPQFQVRNFVIQAIAIFVMHAFEFGQRASQVFRHYVAMLQKLFAAALVYFSVSCRADVSVGVDRAPSSTFPAAFFAAEFLAFIVGPARSSVFVTHESALFRYTAQLALKCRRWFFAHRDWVPVPMGYVKEII